MVIQFTFLCPLSLAVKLNFNISKTLVTKIIINTFIYDGKNKIFHICKLQEFAKQPNLQDFEDYVQGFEFTDNIVSAFPYIS